ncbi:MAG TPA: hypothetical protein ENF35_01445 [Aciduliprofundum sp.]|nr:hypothetical protein [Aciduliprofundum sp.]
MARILAILLILQVIHLGGSWIEVPDEPLLEGVPVNLVLHSPMPDGSKVSLRASEGSLVPGSGILVGGEFKFSLTVETHDEPLSLRTILVTATITFGPISQRTMASVAYIRGSGDLSNARYHAQPLEIYDHEGGFYHDLYEPWCHITSIYMALSYLYPEFNHLLWESYGSWTDHRGHGIPRDDPFFYSPDTTYPVLEFIQLRYLGWITDERGLRYPQLVGIMENVSEDLGLKLEFRIVGPSELRRDEVAIAAVRLWGGHYVFIQRVGGGFVNVFDPSLLEPTGYQGVGFLQHLDPLRTWLLRSVMVRIQPNGTVPESDRTLGLYVVRYGWLSDVLVDVSFLSIRKI